MGAEGKSSRTNLISILRVLRELSDEEHPMTCEEISQALPLDAALSAKTVKRGLDELHDPAIPLQRTDAAYVRTRNGKQVDVGCAWYLEGAFSNRELHALVDGVLRSDLLPPDERALLLKKVENLASRHFENDLKRVAVCCAQTTALDGCNVLGNIAILNRAIDASCLVRFGKGAVGVDGRLRTFVDEDGREEAEVFAPFALVLVDGRYYTIGYPCKKRGSKHTLVHYRVDRLVDVELLGEKAPCAPPPETRPGPDLENYARKHIMMFGGQPMRITLRTVELDPGKRARALHHLFDTFAAGAIEGSRELEDGLVEFDVRSTKEAMRRWAMRFWDEFEVVKPQSLRDQLHEDACKMESCFG